MPLHAHPLSPYALVLVCAFALLPFAPAAFAQTNDGTSGSDSLVGLSVKRAITIGLRGNKTLKASALDVQITHAKLREVLANAYPQINGSASFTDYLNIPATFLPANLFGGPAGEYTKGSFAQQYNANVGVEATQLLFNQTILTSVEAVKVAEKLNSVKSAKDREDLAANIMQVYYGAAVVGQQAAILEANLVAVGKLIKLADANQRNGLIRRLDYEKIAVSKGNLETQLTNLRAVYDEQLGLLRLLMAVPATAPLTLAPIDVTDATNVAADAATNSAGDATLATDATNARTDYQLLLTQARANDVSRRVIEAGYYPTLAAFYQGQYSWQNSNFDKLFSGDLKYPVQAIGLRLQVPIFDGLAKVARTQQNALEQQQLALRTAYTKENIEREVRTTTKKYVAAAAALAQATTNKALADKVYQQSLKEYGEGTTGLTDLLNAETALHDAQNSYLTALSNTLSATVEYRKATGKVLR